MKGINKRILFGFIIVGLLVIFIRFFIGGNEDGWLCENGAWVKHGNPTASMPQEPCGEIPVVKTETEIVPPVNEQNIVIISPKDGEEVGSKFEIQGIARVFENTLQVRVKDQKNGTILFEKTTMCNAKDSGLFGTFIVPIDLSTKRITDGQKITVEALQYSAKDGSEINVASHYVIYKKTTGTTSIKLFFGNTKFEENFSCELVAPVIRKIPKTESVAKVAMEELMKGPTSEEKLAGYVTSIPEGVKVKSVTLKDGILLVDLNEGLKNYGGGSCRVGMIRQQVLETGKQFTTVSSTVISMNGETEGILEP